MNGEAAPRPPRTGARRLLGWAVVSGAALLLLSGLGRTDLWAHLFGLLTGAAIGLLASRWLLRPPGVWIQAVLGILAAALVLGCWWVALPAG